MLAVVETDNIIKGATLRIACRDNLLKHWSPIKKKIIKQKKVLCAVSGCLRYCRYTNLRWVTYSTETGVWIREEEDGYKSNGSLEVTVSISGRSSNLPY
jgi:hypothetical protein